MRYIVKRLLKIGKAEKRGNKFMNYTTASNTEKIKYLLIDVFGEYLRYTVQDKTYEDKISALTKFVRDIRLIKDLRELSKIRRRYE